MPNNSHARALFAVLLLAGALPSHARTLFCEELDTTELRQEVRRAFEQASVVALVDGEPVIVRLSQPDGDEPLLRYNVSNVWKGQVGPSLNVNGYVKGVLFGMRSERSGALDQAGECLGFYEVEAVLRELYGAGYLPSKEVAESLFTDRQKVLLLWTVGLVIVCVVGFVWLVSYGSGGRA